MNFFRISWCYILLQCFYLVVLCGDDYNEYESLVLTKTKNGFWLTKPREFDSINNLGIFNVPIHGETYRFCPDEKNKKNLYSLHITERLSPGSKTREMRICRKPVKAILEEVTNPGKLKNVQWNQKEMALYHAGFTVFNGWWKKVGKLLKRDLRIERIVEYKDKFLTWQNFFLVVEYYYSKKMKQTVAAQYKLLSVNFRHVNDLEIHEYVKFNTAFEFDFKIPKFYNHVDSAEYIEFFKENVEEKWINIFSEVSPYNPISFLEFASMEHFPLTLWSLPAIFPINVIPLWKLPKLMWIRVEIFAGVVARFLDDLRVTAGITDTMTLSNKEVMDSDGFRMAKYFWKVFQLNEGPKVYGIIVVLNCNPFERTQKICEKTLDCVENGWIISNEDYTKGEIYCCRMTPGNIKNLKANHFILEENLDFNLNKWSKKKEAIQIEYKEIISNKQYEIPEPV